MGKGRTFGWEMEETFFWALSEVPFPESSVQVLFVIHCAEMVFEVLYKYAHSARPPCGISL